MFKPKVYADFHNLDDSNRLRLTCAGTSEDLERQHIELHEGLVLTFYMDDADYEGVPDELRTDGVVHYDERESIWVASVDWATVRHASDEERPSGPNGSVGPDLESMRREGLSTRHSSGSLSSVEGPRHPG